MLDPRQLREVAQELALASDERMRLLGGGLLDGLATGDLNKALGLNTGRTGPSPLYRQRKADRNALIRELAQTYAGDRKGRASTVGRELHAYMSIGWKLDRGGEEPTEPRRALMFRICTLDPDPPTSVSALFDIIGPVQ